MATGQTAPTGVNRRSKASPTVRRMRRKTRLKDVHFSIRQDLLEVTEEVLAARRRQALAAGKSVDDYTLPERLRRFTEDGFQAFLRSSIVDFLRLRRPVAWISTTTRAEPEAIRALAVLEGIQLPDAGPEEAEVARLLRRIQEQDAELAAMRLQVAAQARTAARWPKPDAPA